MNNLPKPRKFSGIEQANILISMGSYQVENSRLTAENKRLRNQVDTMSASFQNDFLNLRRVNKELREQVEKSLNENLTLNNEIIRLLSENAKLLNNTLKYRKALEYYANAENYRGIPLVKKSQVLLDNGEFARYALEASSTHD